MAPSTRPAWGHRRLGDIADVRWGDTSTTKASYTESGFPAYSASGQDGFLPWAAFSGAGVVLSAIGAACGKTWLASGSWSCIKNTIRFWATDPEVDTAFLYWVTRDPSIWPKRGSAQPFITQGDARALEVAIPPLPEQRAIAYVLGTFNDKIELNRRLNETLDSIARALFTAWFVEFDPVRAKVEGRDSSLPSRIADLFPDSFEDSESGEIPKGWEVQSLDQIATYLNGLALQKFPADSGATLPAIKIAQLRAAHVGGADLVSVDVPEAYHVHDGDVLFSWSGSLEVAIWSGGEGALNQHLFKVTSDQFPKWFYFLWTEHHLPDFRDIAAGKATTMGHIQRRHLSEAKVLVPPRELLDATDRLIAPLIERGLAARLESRALANLRDVLLPKLLSGEIRVGEADRTVGEALP